VSWQCVHEFRVGEQSANFSTDVATEFARGIGDLVDKRGTTVKDGYNVFTRSVLA
jgi:hypothetical protein